MDQMPSMAGLITPLPQCCVNNCKEEETMLRQDTEGRGSTQTQASPAFWDLQMVSQSSAWYTFPDHNFLCKMEKIPSM